MSFGTKNCNFLLVFKKCLDLSDCPDKKFFNGSGGGSTELRITFALE